MFKKIDHIAIHVKNLNKVVAFYQNIFKFELLMKNVIPTGHNVVYLKLGETILEINEIYEGEIQGCHFCLYTDNFAGDYAYLIENNIKVLQPQHSTKPRTNDEIGWQRAVFLGLSGEQIEIRG